MNEAITYASLIHMIIGFTIGRIIGILFFNRLEKKNDKRNYIHDCYVRGNCNNH